MQLVTKKYHTLRISCDASVFFSAAGSRRFPVIRRRLRTGPVWHAREACFTGTIEYHGDWLRDRHDGSTRACNEAGESHLARGSPISDNP